MRSQSIGGKPGCDLLYMRNGGDFMMNNSYGWMGAGAGGGMWILTVIGVFVVVLLVVLIKKVSTK
jgi:uncharacterized membrane protein